VILICGDALHKLKEIQTDSIDACITDPPYGYSFMNKDWDKAVISSETWMEVLRVLKPGSFAAIMSSPRQDVLARMIVNLQEVGFRTDFTSIYWSYSSGFPKAANITNMLKKRGIDKPQLDGSYAGYQPKPALEVILVCMKPLQEKTFVDQALSNGKGVSWLDYCKLNERFSANLLVSDLILKDHSKYFDLDCWFDTTFPFIICPKASTAERNRGLDKWIYQKVNDGRKTKIDNPFQRGETLRKNTHPTCKPIKLMSYLISLFSREGGDIVLDPFCGSGSTLIAAKMLKRQYIGIDINQEYIEIAKKRLESVYE
jgi:site-specific DNA-methyltransferase (adenine-specific)